MSGPRTEHAEASAPDLEALFREYHPRVFAYIRYRIDDIAEAEDLTSEILERALTHLSSFDTRKGAFSTWLFRIAHNAFVNYWKKRQRRGRYHAIFPEKEDALVASDPTPEQVILQEEQVARLMSSLRVLSLRQQEILSLRFAGQLTNREIARVLKMNERTVSVTILRALRKLRQQLTEEGS